MKILLFGRNGQLGWELQRSLAPLGEVIAFDRAGNAPLAGDLREPEAVAATIRAVKPQVVVNAAAYTAVDKAESEPELAYTVNAHAPAAMAAAASEVGAWCIHYSTDYVFDGSGVQAWKEADPTGPLSVYGASKLQGELLVAQRCPTHLMFRTGWVYAARGGNFAKTMLRLARERDQLSVVNDQWGSPTGADLLADVTAQALRSVLATPALAGLYHAVASGETTWHGYAQYVLKTAQALGLVLKASASDVAAVSSASFPIAAKRPHNSRLDTGKLERVFGLKMPPWQAGVDRMLAEINL